MTTSPAGTGTVLRQIPDTNDQPPTDAGWLKSGLVTRIAARTWVNAGASPAWPGVRTNASGRQRSSEARWIFVVSPPRERPRAWSAGSPAGAPLTGPGGVLVGTDDRGIDGGDPAQVLLSVGLGKQSDEHSLPRAVDRAHA